MVPLKTQSSVDDNIVDSIFYMIPEILTHHSIYLDFLDNVWTHWDTQRSTVGNIINTILAVPDRSYIRHDMVQLFVSFSTSSLVYAHAMGSAGPYWLPPWSRDQKNKKDQCCIWLFSDVVIISSIKRKSGPVTRKVSIILKTPYGQDFAENIKHKVWLRVGLDDLEIVKTQGTLTRKPTIDKEQVEDDLSTVTQMAELAGKLSCQHQGLEDVIKELNATLSRQLSEANARLASSDSNKMELLVTTQEGVLHLVIGFCSAEKRATWETAFTDAKQKLSLLSDKRAPEFLQPLQITKTRAGMQFSCAAPIDGVNQSGFRDVWVCNSDGYVGHMCLLSLQPEPIVTLNTPVPGCNARILCICAVPAFSGAFRRRTSQKGSRSSNRDSVIGSQIPEGPRINVETAEDEDRHLLETQQEQAPPPAPPLPAHSPRIKRMSSPTTVITSPTSPPSTTTTEETSGLGTSDASESFHEEGYQSDSSSSEDDDEVPVSFITRSDELYVGELHSDDDVPKRKVSELTESSPDPITTSGNWDQDPSKSTMWLGTEDGWYVYTSFQVGSDPSKAVQCLVSSGQGVWVASQQTSKVMLFHAVTYEFLLEVSIAQAVSQKLQSADDIIRQHKAACLRITALMVCKDLLWVGTSAGVILTIPIPRITSTTTRGSLAMPVVTGLVYGHTGHVRFLTSVEISSTSSSKSDVLRGDTSDKGETSAGSAGFSLQDIHRRSSMAATTATMASRMLVISGGDGYEDFRNSAANEGAGRDDSTNHLLLWQV
ncbi:rho guanine nucleotide exchange factor 17 [Elysia marginata]|uniref:Rho guanine nucleotide exchange factor 17 n=1 Tax=Elysia marginata TaxID=1093978 RepID=A0AAV4INC2_9GAST|nr:rho guanine nucleotide exchange factor 17 [Elysia marginata]